MKGRTRARAFLGLRVQIDRQRGLGFNGKAIRSSRAAISMGLVCGKRVAVNLSARLLKFLFDFQVAAGVIDGVEGLEVELLMGYCA